ncbi:MAG: V-type ATP synthase subunit A, partial [Deltaproteobacteria bacterium]|nr:V-type ATP synthase subunit A [Deltaproteobacteria bacterium]
AFSRHFPAINWLSSYSLYQDVVDGSADERIDSQWAANRKRAMSILQREAELDELVRLVGIDALAHEDRLLMQAAKMIREDFLHQNAFDDRDSYTSLGKQFNLLKVILHYYDEAKAGLAAGIGLDDLIGIEELDEIARAKLIPEDAIEQFRELEEKLTGAIRGKIQS